MAMPHEKPGAGSGDWIVVAAPRGGDGLAGGGGVCGPARGDHQKGDAACAAAFPGDGNDPGAPAARAPPPGYAALRPNRLRPSVVLLGQGTDIRTVQDVWGHQDVKMTEICTHVMKEPGMGVRSPLDEDPAGTEPAT